METKCLQRPCLNFIEEERSNSRFTDTHFRILTDLLLVSQTVVEMKEYALGFVDSVLYVKVTQYSIFKTTILERKRKGWAS